MIPTKQQTKKRFVIYTRCSTDDQAQGDFTTLDAQAHHCKNMLDALGYELADFGKKGIISDDGYSGKDLNRPGIQTILSGIDKQKAFDGIIFFRLDRLTRNPRDLYGLIDLFKENETDFISVRENLDSSSALGRVVIGIIGLLSAFERELTGERVKASGIARARQGKWIGGALPFGYKLVNNGDPLPNGRQPHKILIDPETGPKIKQIWRMAAENQSLRTIAKELTSQGIKSAKGKPIWKQTVLRIIKNRFYLGYVTWAGETHKAQHEPIIDKPTWEKANKMISENLPGHRFLQQPKKYVYLLERLLRCGSCGSHMIATHSNGRSDKKFYYYNCSRMKQGLGCSMPRMNAEGFDNALIEYFQRSSKDRELIIQAIEDAVKDARARLQGANKEIAVIEKKFEDRKNEAEKLLDLALKGEISKGVIYKARMEKLDEEMEAFQNELSKLEAQKRVAEISASSGDFIHSNISYAMDSFDEASPGARQALFRALIKQVIVHEDRLEITMLIGQPLEKRLDPEKNAQTNPNANSGLPERNEWRPTRYAGQISEVQQIQLLVRFERKRGVSVLLSIAKPAPKDPPMEPIDNRNVVAKALQFHAFLKADPTRFHGEIAQKLGAPRPQVTQYLKLVDRLPKGFIDRMKACNDPKTLRRFSGRALLKISKLHSMEEREQAIARLHSTT